MAKEVQIIKVAADSNVKSVAGSISHALKGDETVGAKNVEILAIGAGAVNQAYKACAISSGHLANYGETLIIRPGFKVSEINGEEKTIMRFIVSTM
jgi:stage V sporulation protein S